MYVHNYRGKKTAHSIKIYRRLTRQLNLTLDLYLKNFVDRNRVCAPTVELNLADYITHTHCYLPSSFRDVNQFRVRGAKKPPHTRNRRHGPMQVPGNKSYGVTHLAQPEL